MGLGMHLQRKFVNVLPNGLSGVQWTLLMPLMSRARITMKYGNLLNDPKAIEIVEMLSGHLSIDDDKVLYYDLGNAARSRNLDDAIKTFVKDHPNATIVNLGSGLDTAFSRNDNGKMTWFDVDLPDVMEMRKLIIPETDRSHCIACSILDGAWMRAINPDTGGLFFIAGGVLSYFTKQEVECILYSLAYNFPTSEFAFDTVSRAGRSISNRLIKRVGISSAEMKWAFGRNDSFKELDGRVVVMRHYPMFANIERSSNFGKNVISIMDRCDKMWNMSMVHLGFDA
jgi:O-methyltransferase involved in polyketide biosynthesis